MYKRQAVDKSQKSIKGLLEIKTDSVTVERNGEVQAIAPEEINIGDTIAVSYTHLDVYKRQLLYTTVTDLAPILRAVLAASIATLPAPITRTVSPLSTGTSFLSRDLLL